MQRPPRKHQPGNNEQGELKEGSALSCAAAFPIAERDAPEAIIVDAMRCWRDTIDRHLPVLPILFARLEARGAGFLAPAIDALLALHEAWSGQRFRAANQTDPALSDDERQLLGLLEAARPPELPHPAQPGLAGPLHIAVRSTRLLVRWVLGSDLGETPLSKRPGAGEPVFFSRTEAPAAFLETARPHERPDAS